MTFPKTLFQFLYFLSLFSWIATPVLAAEKVTLQLKWFHQFQFAGYYAAKEKGYYAEAGFDVEILERDPQIRTIDAVLDGDADFGISGSSLILHRLQKKPVVILGAIFQHSPLVLITRPEDNLLGPYELKGKRVMFQKGQDDAVLIAMFHQLGIKDTEYTHVPHSFDDDALLNKKVDAMSGYLTDQPFYYAQAGMNVRVINPLNYGIDFYGDMLFANEKAVRDDPDRANRFLKASLRGWRYALKHKEEVIGWLKSKYLSNKTVAHLRYEADQTERMILPNVVEIGYTNMNRFQRIAEIYRNEKMVPIDSEYDGVYFGDYISSYPTIPYWVNVLVIAVGVIFLCALILLALNRKLNNLVAVRTQELAMARDQAQSSNQAKSNFISIVSHELRTPLTSIKGSISLLANSALELPPKKARELLEVAERNVVRLADLVDDILDVEQIETGSMSYNFVPLELTGLVKEAVETNKGYAVLHDVRFIPATLIDGITVNGDAVRLTQVISNLLSNAAKFSPADSDVNVSVTRDDGVAKVSISDAGPGVPERFRSKIFERFTQLDSADNRRIGGTGLGLNISRSIVERHGGRIGFKPNSGGGSTFYFTLPIHQ